jgi:hypothetical protein
MKILLDIKDHKVDFVLELLKNFTFVKATPLQNTNHELANEIANSVKEMNLVLSGKSKARPIQELLDEL